MPFVRLTKKLALSIDGIDLNGHAVGDVLELPSRDARLLVAEGWAEPEQRAARERRAFGSASQRSLAVAADSARKRRHRRTRSKKS